MTLIQDKEVLNDPFTTTYRCHPEETDIGFLSRITKEYQAYFLELSKNTALAHFKATAFQSNVSWEQWGKYLSDGKDQCKSIFRKRAKMTREGQEAYLIKTTKAASKKFIQTLAGILKRIKIGQNIDSPIIMAEVTKRGDEIKLVISQSNKITSVVIRATVRQNSVCYLFLRYTS